VNDELHIGPVVPSLLSYLIGLGFYAAHFPERILPNYVQRRLDCIGGGVLLNSFHCSGELIIAVRLTFYMALLYYPCSQSAQGRYFITESWHAMSSSLVFDRAEYLLCVGGTNADFIRFNTTVLRNHCHSTYNSQFYIPITRSVRIFPERAR
jgi:hypothetical protein